MGTPDVQSAAIGSGAVKDYEGHIYIGTSSWLTCHVPFKKTDILHNMASLPSALPGKYFVANATETAGACINWLRDNLLFPDDALRDGPAPSDFYARLNAVAAEAPPGSDKVIFTPWLIGERSPVADATLRGAFFNQSLSTTRAHLCRAVMEGVAYNSRWLLQYVEKFIGRRMPAPNDRRGRRARSCGARSTPTCSTARSIRSKIPSSATLAGPGCWRAWAWGTSGSTTSAPTSACRPPSAPTPPRGPSTTSCSAPTSTCIAPPAASAPASTPLDPGKTMGLRDLTKQRLAGLEQAGQGVLDKLFQYAKRLPFVRERIEAEYDKILTELRSGARPYRDEVPTFRELPTRGRPREEVLAEMEALAHEEDRWREGYVSAPSTTATPNTWLSSTGSTPSTPRPIRCTRTCGRGSPSTRPRSWR